MNYLAHAFLSGNNPRLLLGNFLADGIRGNQLGQYDLEIKQGILLHRHIDSYTDQSPLNEQARKYLQPVAGKYAGVVLDIFYDHLLAVNWKIFHPQPLEDFVEWCYSIVEENQEILPERTAFMFPYMRKGNWLVNYGTQAGIMRSLAGLSARIASHPNLAGAGELAFDNKAELEKLFLDFFPGLQHAVAKFLALKS